MKNSYQDSLGRTTQTLDYVVVVHILFRDKRKSQINEYSDYYVIKVLYIIRLILKAEKSKRLIGL